MRRYESKRQGGGVAAPLVVLIGPGTRGSGELLAAALSEAGRAVSVGRRTFGFAARQREFPIPGEGRKVRLTVERFQGPDGVELTGTGVGAALASPPPLPREVANVLERRRVALRIADRLSATPPAEYDAAALKRGEL